jgi:PAS domain-containing protein
MKVVCAWCNKDLGEKHAESGTDDIISHGICPKCAQKLLAPMAMPMTSFLDQFPAPVFLVDGEGRVISANSKAYSLVGKNPAAVDGMLGGPVFECKFADLPGGCGHTIHCKSCTIRLTVTDTIQTSKSHYRVPAYPDLHLVTGDKKIRFLISTQKVDGSVLLVIDEIRIIEKENQ